MPVEIIDASAPPEGELIKDVYAYFGLCMYFAQVFETGLINVLTVLETSSQSATTQQAYATLFDKLYVKHEMLTFGNLLKALMQHNFLPSDVLENAKALKSERDHLAHRFFRDHSRDALTVGGCLQMIEILEESRMRFQDLDCRVTKLLDEAFVKRGASPSWLKQETKRLMDEMRDEAIAQRCSKVRPA